ncbi:phosphoribosylglycinamide formyltransferase-1 [Balnearium lithotrophicum]|uniref:Phosphoribosylglycinamide formyltransferase n=1 Tax=Balnearium lithotrophicum TaxID=223788 RepID=A0A521CBV0_9BACT|nr:phosphoribosylglycinamide formyltransferase [Balnearium lithotrophicum]SMO56878.1 phosphoribosylglycinamide formyltransferase-1 [Balnearium lithotrophicum]
MRVAVLASGRGSNFYQIGKAFKEGKISGEIVVLITNNRKARAIEKAEELGINWVFLNPKSFPSREDYDKKIVEILKFLKVDLVCLAGYMLVVTPVFIDAFPNRILNIHPSLLPSFPGLKPHWQALTYGVKISGATVHIVDKGVDTGPIVVQAAVPVLPEDMEDSLSERILRWEHRIYPQAVKWFVDGRVEVNGRNVLIKKADYSQLPVVPALEDF